MWWWRSLGVCNTSVYGLIIMNVYYSNLLGKQENFWDAEASGEVCLCDFLDSTEGLSRAWSSFSSFFKCPTCDSLYAVVSSWQAAEAEHVYSSVLRSSSRGSTIPWGEWHGSFSHSLPSLLFCSAWCFITLSNSRQ